jgi:VanZ family protein
VAGPRGEAKERTGRRMTQHHVRRRSDVVTLLAQEMVRTGLPGQFEHLIAYAGSTAIASAGYGLNRGGMWIIGGFWAYAGVLEYLQHFSPGRHPSVEDFAVSALGALFGGLVVALLWRSPEVRRHLGR